MLSTGDFRVDVASGLSLGRRARQEDAVVTDFAMGAPFGFAVLSDGMGGHAAGDVAANIVVTELFSELKMRCDDVEAFEVDLEDILLDAVEGANNCVALYAQENPEAFGMGATLVAPILFANRLYWVSVGDSPLYLFRDGQLLRLNEDHSYAAELDHLRAQGICDQEEALSHPDRNCLTSVLSGGAVARIDCRSEPLALQDGDIVVAASDGLLSLGDSDIAAILAQTASQPSNAIGRALMTAVDGLGHPDQDNLSFCVIKLARSETGQMADDQPAPVEFMADMPASADRGAEVVRIDRRSQNGSVRTVFCMSRKAGQR
ncbi:PP2C family protein-serine/threonine phosphatase [Shimia biformata]|uniref:PP2C family protein-serine/threonine phosphatase n=1 Tax=Shimia biformata TaxID=1294299 RepID=UPI0019517CFA|nr:protein phosphatase 2C domain-containing protein [Shimia biformata]